MAKDSCEQIHDTGRPLRTSEWQRPPTSECHFILSLLGTAARPLLTITSSSYNETKTCCRTLCHLRRLYVECPDTRVNTADTLYCNMPSSYLFASSPSLTWNLLFFWLSHTEHRTGMKGIVDSSVSFSHNNFTRWWWPPNSECHSVLSTPFINGAVSEGVVENEADVFATLSSTRPHTPGHITTVGAWKCSRKPRLPKNAFT